MARTVDPVGRHLALKLGKKPARPGAVKFKFANFLLKPKLPTPPKVFGHEGLIGANWAVLGNDHYGDCVWAGAAHETMLWNKEAARTVLARVHGSRHRIEELLEQGKQEVGLSHYEVRRWTGWTQHMTLSQLALWFLQVERLRLGKKHRR